MLLAMGLNRCLVCALNPMILRRKRGDACGITQKPNPRISIEDNIPIYLHFQIVVPDWVLRSNLGCLLINLDAAEWL